MKTIDIEHWHSSGGASGDDWNGKEDSIKNLSIVYIFSGVILMMIKHDKITSYCMVRRFKALISSIDGLQNYEFGNKVTEFDKNYSNHQRVECF